MILWVGNQFGREGNVQDFADRTKSSAGVNSKFLLVSCHQKRHRNTRVESLSQQPGRQSPAAEKKGVDIGEGRCCAVVGNGIVEIRVSAVAAEGSEKGPDPLGVALLAGGKAQV